jgi:hypothetical protein
VAIAARIAGRKPPKLAIPTTLIRMMAPFGRVMGPLLGQPPNLREVVRASHRVTYWATHAKAEQELGYTPRDLETTLRDTAASIGPT